MAIPTTRTNSEGKIKIFDNLCNGCGLCINVCKDFSICMVNGKVSLSDKAIFGCIACGHCMAICPSNAIEITGREISTNDIFELTNMAVLSYENLLNLLQKRRSIREFKDKKVESEYIDKILSAAQTAPMGLPPTDVNVLIIEGKEKNRKFAQDYSEFLKNYKFMTNQYFISMMRLFWGKETSEMFKGFIKPLYRIYTEEIEKGSNLINYDAPLSMYFYGSPYADPADPLIAATYAMIAAESLGLGTCMLGAIHPFLQNGKKAERFRKEHNIKFKSKEGIFIIFGHPAVKYKSGINRTFASISYLE